MKLKNQILLLVLTICIGSFSIKSQSLSEENWRDTDPQTVTLYSRIKHKFDGYGKSAFSFKHGLRSDIGKERTKNNYEISYGGISINGDSDWFKVTMVTDDCSRIKDLGELNWSDIFDVPILQASIEPHKGIRTPLKTETFEESSNGQITRVTAGHIYVVHSKDFDSDFYTLFRVDKLIPSDEVTISWKIVPSPEQ